MIQVGVLSEGMLADVIIVDSDPLQDVRVLNNRCATAAHRFLQFFFSAGGLAAGVD